MPISGRLGLCSWLIETQSWVKLHVRIAVFEENVYILYVAEMA